MKIITDKTGCGCRNLKKLWPGAGLKVNISHFFFDTFPWKTLKNMITFIICCSKSLHYDDQKFFFL